MSFPGLRPSNRTYKIVNEMKNLNDLKQYGLTESEIRELHDIKAEGSKLKKEIRGELKEMVEDLEA